MIASFLHRFVFIKTRKTGGTSVEIVLSSWCGDGDICTPVTPEDELLRIRYGGLPRGWSGDASMDARYAAAVQAGDARALRRLHRRIAHARSVRSAIRHRDLQALLWRARQKLGGRPVYRNHMRAAAARRALPRDFWESAFTFSIDRHPYEKAISMASWRRERRVVPDEPFERTLDDLVRSGRYANHPFYMREGRLLVDRVFRTEEMWPEIADLGRRVGRELPAEIPRAKSGRRADQRPAREILTGEQRRIVQEVCAPEFELLGYER